MLATKVADVDGRVEILDDCDELLRIVSEEVDSITSSDRISSPSSLNTSDPVRRAQTPTRPWKLNRLLMRNRRARLGGEKLEGIGIEKLRLGLPPTDCCLTVDPIDRHLEVDAVFDGSMLV